jgi:hypothetical protein
MTIQDVPFIIRNQIEHASRLVKTPFLLLNIQNSILTRMHFIEARTELAVPRFIAYLFVLFLRCIANVATRQRGDQQ